MEERAIAVESGFVTQFADTGILGKLHAIQFFPREIILMRPDVFRQTASVLTRSGKDHHDHIDDTVATPAVGRKVYIRSHTGITDHLFRIGVVTSLSSLVLTIIAHSLRQHDRPYDIEYGLEQSPTLLLEIVGHTAGCAML